MKRTKQRIIPVMLIRQHRWNYKAGQVAQGAMKSKSFAMLYHSFGEAIKDLYSLIVGGRTNATRVVKTTPQTNS